MIKLSFLMWEFFQESGKDSQEKKKNYIKSLLVAATDCEPQYLIRLLQVRVCLFFFSFLFFIELVSCCIAH